MLHATYEGTFPLLLVLPELLDQVGRPLHLLLTGTERRLNDWHLRGVDDLLARESHSGALLGILLQTFEILIVDVPNGMKHDENGNEARATDKCNCNRIQLLTRGRWPAAQMPSPPPPPSAWRTEARKPRWSSWPRCRPRNRRCRRRPPPGRGWTSS